MKAGLWLALTTCCIPTPLAAQPDWQPVEKIEAYAITGQSGIELYESIGERGPKAGIGRALAVTTFKLTWSRDYRPEGGGCRLATARPKLTITYHLPKPARTLPPATQALWKDFIAGIEAHERVHGEFIVDMVRKIEAVSVGLAVADDPGCKKIREELTKHLAALSQEQRARGRDFDRAELRDGGNVHQLVLRLVNGDRPMPAPPETMPPPSPGDTSLPGVSSLPGITSTPGVEAP